jgi:hypothetical protein
MSTMKADHRSVRPGTIFELVRGLEHLPPHYKLLNLEWGVLFAVTGAHTVAQIGEHLGLTEAERDAVFGRLLRAGLIRERRVTYAEYLRAVATIRDDEPKPMARFLRSGAALEGGPPPALKAPVVPEAKASAAQPRQTAAAVQDRRGDGESSEADRIRTVASGRGSSFEPLAAVPEADKPAGEKLSLKAVMRLIIDRAADTTVGQLDIYRVFIRIDTNLLRRNGITTLRFEEDWLVSDPELQSAITANVEKILGFTCPPSVYV